MCAFKKINGHKDVYFKNSVQLKLITPHLSQSPNVKLLKFYSLLQVSFTTNRNDSMIKYTGTLLVSITAYLKKTKINLRIEEGK